MMCSLKWAGALALILNCVLMAEGECVYNAIGLHDDTVFPNSAFNANVQESGYEAFEARFGRNGWCTPPGFPPGFPLSLTINFGRLIKVCAVKTAGVASLSSFSSSINMELLLDTGPGTPTIVIDSQVLNNVSPDPMIHHLISPQMARYIRFTIFSANIQECLKVEVYRDKGECGNHPVGISDSVIIPNDNIGDTDADADLEAIHVRMSDEKAWCNNDPAELTIDFGKTVEVCAIETRGYNDGGRPRSTTTFSLKFAGDDSVFSDYQENSIQRVFSRIRGIETEFHLLFEPVSARKMTIAALNNDFCLSVEVYRSDTGSCYDSIISFSDISGSENTNPSFPASNAELNDNSAWCTTSTSSGYLQVDLGGLRVVCAVAVQGLSVPEVNNIYTTSFKLSFAYTDTDHEWVQFYEEGGNEREFIISPADGNVIVKRELAISQVAKYMRFYPTASNSDVEFCMRVEVYGRDGGCLQLPVGITDAFIIPDSRITAFPVDVGSPPTQVRMSETSAWCLPVDESGSPYLEVDFGENIEVCAVETKGYDDGMVIGYTKEFKLSFQADGENSFTPYTEDGETRIFRKGSPLRQEIHMLYESVVACKMRFEPITGQDSRICTSLEVYRKRDDKEGSCYDSVIDSSDTRGDGSTEVEYPAANADLDDVGEAWCSSASSGNAYLQVDFGSLKVVCAIAVQGLSDDSGDVFPTKFKLSFATSEISSVLTQFYQEGGEDRVFIISPADGNVIVKRKLAISQVAKYMRFYPTDGSSADVPRFCLRVAVFGIDGECLHFPVGISDPFIIPDASITASSFAIDSHPTQARMSDPSAWCLPDDEPGSPYLEVDFGENIEVCAVETRGYNNLYTQEFKLSFKADGDGSFTEYTEDGEIRFFRKGSSADQEIHMLYERVVARIMRLYPSDQELQVCTSLEVYRVNKEVSECREVTWGSSLGNEGWSTCGDTTNYNTYLRAFYRSSRTDPDFLSNLEKVDCCNPRKEVYNYENPTADSQDCQDVSFPELQGDFATWAVCPEGYFLRGINVEETNPLIGSGYSFDAMYLLVDDITQGQCCRPKHHPSEWESCYDEDIWSPFDGTGWVSCSASEDYFIAGFYKNFCDNLFCIENLRCCSMKTIQEPCFSQDIPFQYVSGDDGTLPGFPSSDASFYVENQAWCTDNSYPNAFFEIDFGDLYVVCAVGIRGRYTGSTAEDNTFTTKFKLAFAIANDEVWNFYEEPDGNDREFVIAPATGDWVVNRKLARSQMARYIRFYPKETSPSDQACLRVEVWGRRALRVDCLDDGYVVAHVARETLGPDINTLNLDDPDPSGCSVAVPADHKDDFEIEYYVSDCGTVNVKVGDTIQSTNHITGVAQGTVVHTYDADYTVNCEYDAKDTLSDSFRPLHNVGDTPTETGDFDFDFELYLDAERSITYNDQQLDLNVQLYARVMIVSNPSYLTLMIERCWATPTSNRNDPRSYDLIYHSCNVGDEVDSSYVCDTDDTIQDFQFKSFRFTEQDSGSVYLHVRAKVCLADYGSSECNLYCNGPFPCGFEDRKRRSVNQNPRNNSADNRYAKPYFVDIGPIRVAEEQKAVPSAQDAKTHLSAAAVSGIVLGVVVPLAVACALLFIAVRYRRKSDEGNPAVLEMYAETTGSVNQAISS